MRLHTCILILLVAAGPALSQDGVSPREQLKQHVADLQRSPDDQSLREKIVKLAATLDPKPAIPEEARRHFVKAVTIQKEAKEAGDYELAIREYKGALLLAPWWPEAYYNLGVAFEAAKRYDDAIKTLKLYLLTKPTEDEARSANDRIYAVEAKKDLAGREKDREAERERLKAEEDARKAKAQSLVGFWGNLRPGEQSYKPDLDGGLEVSQNGGTWTLVVFAGRSRYSYQPTNVNVGARYLSYDVKYGSDANDVSHIELNLSEDGTRLTGRYRNDSLGTGGKLTFIRVR